MLLRQFSVSVLLLAVLLAAALTSCGRHSVRGLSASSVILDPAPRPRMDVQRIIAARAALVHETCPAGVNRANFEALRGMLDGQLARLAEGKRVSQLPDQSKNAIADAQVVDDGSGGFSLTWSYRNAGDYDQNGEVNISDLTPLGINLGKTSTGPGWSKAQVADGDGNGLISIADITPIGANFFAQIAGYYIYSSASEDGPWTSLGQVEFADGAAGNTRSFSYDLGASPPAFLLISPYDASGLDWQRGPDTQPALVQLGSDTPQGESTITSSGGTLAADSGGVLSGLNVSVPSNAFDIDTQVAVSSNDGSVTPLFGTQASPLIQLSTDYGTTFNQPLELSVPFSKDPNAVPVPYYIDADSELHVCDITSLDMDAGVIKFNTWHASSFVVLNAILNDPGADMCDTKFDPGEDGFQVDDGGSQYNLAGESLGMCAFASWYYRAHRKKGEAPLYKSFTKVVGGRKGQQIIATRAYNSAGRGIDDYIGFLKWQWKLPDSQEWWVIQAAMLNAALHLEEAAKKGKSAPRAQ